MNGSSHTDTIGGSGPPMRIRYLLGGICALLFLIDFVFPPEGHFGFDGFPGFHSLLGFMACVILILVSKVAGFFLKAPENYYE